MGCRDFSNAEPGLERCLLPVLKSILLVRPVPFDIRSWLMPAPPDIRMTARQARSTVDTGEQKLAISGCS